MVRRWTLPGPRFPYLILLEEDAGTRGAAPRVPPPAVLQMLDRWSITSRQALQEMSWALSSNARTVRRGETLEQLQERLAHAFRFGDLRAFEIHGPLDCIEEAPRQQGADEAVEESPANLKQFSTAMRVSTALRLSWKSWPGHVGQTALESFSDPTFILTLLGVTGIYVGLWLTPDPTLLTKVLAGVLTGALLAQFAWEDIYGLAQAWCAMKESCERARNPAELQTAGDAFARKVGQVGFDILLFLVMWRVGHQVQPKLQQHGIRRALRHAEAQVEAAASKPGSGRVLPAQAESLKDLDAARSRTTSPHPTPTHILDALDLGLSEAGRRGLAGMRNRLGDAKTLARLENVLVKGGKDLGSFLKHEGASPSEAKEAKASLLKAQQALARVRIIEMKTMWDQTLRKAAGAELRNSFIRLLKSLDVPPDWARIQEQIRTRDIDGLVAELGEALQRTLLVEKYPPSSGYRIFANVEVVREVNGFKRKAAWQEAERHAGKEGNPRGLYERDGKLWKSITEVDALVAKKAPDGAWRLVELEQMKTGVNDQPVRAREQNDTALKALQAMSNGSKNIQIYERITKNTLGKNLSHQFDLSSLQDISTATRGLSGKAFDDNIPFSREILQGVATLLTRHGLPPELHNPPPTVSDRRPGDGKAAR